MTSELVAGFPRGVLLISDSQSTEQIPSWSAPDEQVARAETALVVRVQHADEGEVSVRLVAVESDARGPLVFEGTLRLESGTLRASDAHGHKAMDVVVTPGSHLLCLYADDPSEATAVDLLID